MNGQRPLLTYKKRVSKFLESPQNKSFTMLGLTFIALTIFGAFAIRPTISTIIKLNKRIDEGKAIEKKMQIKIDALNSLQQKAFAKERQIEFAKEALPPKEKMDVIIANMELVAKKYDLKLLSIAPGDEPNSEELGLLPEGVSALSMSLTLDGENDDFHKFIDHIENLPRQINVRRAGYIFEDEVLVQRAEIVYFFSNLF